jgi:adenosylcobinamide-GDP ribazoletransferase
MPLKTLAAGVRHFLLALQFFTRIPVTGRLARWVGYSPAMLRASAAHFPAVGWVVGAIGALAFALASAVWPPVVAAVLATVATVLATGAFHEDGLADVADGLGGTQDRARALEIMRDSRIGAFGAIALVLALGLKLALLTTLAPAGEPAGSDGMSGPIDPGPGGAAVTCAGLLAAHVLSRLAPLGPMRWLPHVSGEAAKSKPLADAVTVPALGVALAWSVPAVLLLVFAFGAAAAFGALAAAGLVTFAMSRWFRHRLGGFTGDCLGATQQVAEIAIYLALAARW